MSTTRSLWLAAAVLVMGLVFSGGCANTKLTDENEKLRTQNEEAQGELNKTRSALEKADAERMAKDAENARLQAELNGLKNRPPVVVNNTTTPPASGTSGTPAKPAKGMSDVGGDGITVEQGVGKITVRIPGDVLFDSGKADVKSSAKAALDRIAVAINRDYSGKHIRIDGFTDTDPIKHSKWPSNQALSEARAASVKAYLIKKGIPASRMDIVGHGSAEPRETKAKSRRVEIVVFTG